MPALLMRPLLYAAAACLCACEVFSSVPDGQIEFKNQLGGDKFNKIEVEGPGISRVLKPGDKVLFPRGTTWFNLSYYNGKLTRNYSVRCPAKIKKGIRIRLIDVHSNRMPGGCESVS